MLPLLPALLLLIFRGPVPQDFRFQLADSRLGSERLEVNSGRQGAFNEPRHVVALLALSKNPTFSRTVAELLRYLPSDEPRTASKAAQVDEAGLPCTIEHPRAGRECAGFITAQRSRDGPVLL